MFPPDQSINAEPVFHQRVLLRTIALQSIMKVAGRFDENAADAAALSHLARREASSPVQLRAVGPVPIPSDWLTS